MNSFLVVAKKFCATTSKENGVNKGTSINDVIREGGGGLKNDNMGRFDKGREAKNGRVGVTSFMNGP